MGFTTVAVVLFDEIPLFEASVPIAVFGERRSGLPEFDMRAVVRRGRPGTDGRRHHPRRAARPGRRRRRGPGDRADLAAPARPPAVAGGAGKRCAGPTTRGDGGRPLPRHVRPRRHRAAGRAHGHDALALRLAARLDVSADPGQTRRTLRGRGQHPDLGGKRGRHRPLPAPHPPDVRPADGQTTSPGAWWCRPIGPVARHSTSTIRCRLPIDGDPLGETLDWALRHLDQEITVDALSARALMSRRTFDRRFRQVTGTTPTQWLLHQRILHAQRLLETTGSRSSGWPAAWASPRRWPCGPTSAARSGSPPPPTERPSADPRRRPRPVPTDRQAVPDLA